MNLNCLKYYRLQWDEWSLFVYRLIVMVDVYRALFIILVCKYVIEGKEEHRKQKTLKHHFTYVFETIQGRRSTLGSLKHPSLQRDL